MKRRLAIFGVTSICLFSQVDIKPNQVNIAFTMSMAPYLMEKNRSGIELDIIMYALNASGHTFKLYGNIPYKRAIRLMAEKEVDGIASNLNNKDYSQTKIKFYNSATTLNYIDCAITLKENNFVLKTMSDYQNKSIMAFASASATIGPLFYKMTKSNKEYSENIEQRKHYVLLLKNRIQVAIGDKNIFNTVVRREIGDQINLFKFHNLTDPTPRNVKFYDIKLRNDFNKGLKIIKQNGKYQEILDRYKDIYSVKCNLDH